MHQEEEIIEDTISQKGFHYKYFILKEEIGKGTFGRVIAASHKSSEIEFAIKEMIREEEIKTYETNIEDFFIEKEVSKKFFNL